MLADVFDFRAREIAEFLSMTEGAEDTNMEKTILV
ncbi:hypothetical protein PVOR_26910 [Paenibacillus vortex V453]|uniref:Uncharacterized protein n=1 Tax=Paenibacillus vortex V453 TaxID=715225 RepID=A0A2R9SNK2_9BACL|nr:hypothetical protein PVOR_26910 [Paenibacillus vortex V453]